MSDTTDTRAGVWRARALLGVLAGVLALGSGCGYDSWFNQSVVGRWEVTPTVVPVLDRITAIEGPEDDFVEFDEVRPDDLVPRPTEYRIGPGDAIAITVFDLIGAGVPTQVQTVVDSRGTIYIDELGEISVAGLNRDELSQRLEEVARTRGGINRPLVQAQIVNPRQARYTVVGAVPGPGTYLLPEADFRLLDALAEAGWIPESTREIFVIRQIPLDEVVEPDLGGEPLQGDRGQPGPGPSGEDLLRDVDSLLRGGGSEGGAGEDDPSPSAFGARGLARAQAQDGGEGSPEGPPEAAIGLVDGPAAGQERPEPQGAAGEGEGTWMFLNGRWVQVSSPGGSGGPGAQGEGAAALAGELDTGQLVTQRVIRVPAQQLIAGDMRLNIVIEPGDIVRVPTNPQGFYYIGGFVNRPGSFGLAPKLTLMRAIDASGGVNQLGVPRRVELVRMVGGDRQATIMLDLRAINNGVEPDIFLKANDRINVGSAWWTFPLTVVRNGFRASYGFGFLLDRNFGNDVFGAPPSNVGR